MVDKSWSERSVLKSEGFGQVEVIVLQIDWTIACRRLLTLVEDWWQYLMHKYMFEAADNLIYFEISFCGFHNFDEIDILIHYVCRIN